MFNGSPLKMMKNALKMMKNAFIFPLVEALFVFCLEFLVMKKKRLDSKDMFNFKTYDVTTWLTSICCTYNTQHLTN